MALKPKNNSSQWRIAADYGSVGLEMGIAAAIGCYGGLWLDEYFGTEPWLLLLGMLCGFGAAGKAIYRVAVKAKQAMAGGNEGDPR